MTTFFSPSITNLDAVAAPYIVKQNTAGEGGVGSLKHINDYAVVAASAATGTVYRMVRIPSSAKVKNVVGESEALTAGKMNISVYYSDSKFDGTQVANQGLIVPTTGDQFFASDVDFASAVARTSYVNESGNYPIAKRNLPLWSALGLTSDPGGYFDICYVCHTTAVSGSGGNMSLEVEYLE